MPATGKMLEKVFFFLLNLERLWLRMGALEILNTAEIANIKSQSDGIL